MKRFVDVEDTETVTMRQLRYAFKDDAPWVDLQDEDSILFRVFNHPILKDDEKPEKINVIKVLILGLLLCAGCNEMKTRVMYDILQDNMQEKISSSDKDFKFFFENLVKIGSYLILQIYREEAN